MPIAVLTEIPYGTAEIHEQIWAKLGVRGDNLPKGMLVHAAGPIDGGGWRIFDVWESQEALDDFEHDLIPAVEEVVGTAPEGDPPRRTMYELHSFFRPGG